LRMAGHAGFRRWHSGERGFLNSRVAVAAVQTQTVNVMLVAEGNWLFERHHLERRPWRPINGMQNPSARAEQQHDGCERCAGDGIGSATKNLRHSIAGNF
jgi:hypothetical protein